MPVEVVMPKLGLTMESGTIARWMKQAGDAVRAGEPLVEVATDKINYEVECPADGTLASTAGNDGEEFPCGAVIGTIAVEDDASPAASHNGAARIVASPAARKLARERDVPLAALRGTGPRGRITMTDVLTHAEQRPASRPAAAASAPAVPSDRRAIFRKMTDVGTLPLAQVETVVDVEAVRALMQRRGDFRWTAFVVYAVSRLLHAHPVMRTDASTGAPFARVNVGVAADTPQGLIVPVVRDADALPLAAIEAEIVRLANRARDGALTVDEVGGACFSISNVGPQGIERVSPLPDPPQTAILGVGAVTQRAAVRDGALAVAWMMTCVVSFDHRYVDGAPAARFLADFSRACADPGTLL